MGWTIFVGAVFVLLGTLAFWKPDWVWKLLEQWKSYDATEPSDLYRFNAKCGGAAFALLGIIMILLPFCLE